VALSSPTGQRCSGDRARRSPGLAGGALPDVEPMTIRALIVLPLLLLAGCSAATTPGSRYRMDGPRTLGGVSFESMTSCGTNVDVAATRCFAVVTDNPADEQAWMFEYRVKNYLWGIPIGRQPLDYVLAGARETCEAVRASMTEGTYMSFGKRQPAVTEPCKGPLYFRREAAPSAR